MNWTKIETPQVGASVKYRDGYLAAIRYNFQMRYWEISLFNGMIKYTRDRTETQIEEVKELAIKGIKSSLKELERNYD